MIDNLLAISPREKFEFHVLTRHPSKWEEENYGVIQHQNLEYPSREESRNKWMRGLNYEDDRNIFYDFLSFLGSMDMLIVGAGNFMIDMAFDLFKGPIPIVWWCIHLAKLHKKKVMLYGFSAVPLQNEYARLLSRNIVEMSDLVTVRDTYTKRYIESLRPGREIHLLPDPALGVNVRLDQDLSDFLNSDEMFFINNNMKPIIAIGLRALDFLPLKGEVVFSAIIDFINNNKQFSYLFVPQSTYIEDDDVKKATEVSLMLEEGVNFHIIKCRYNPKNLVKIYNLCNLTLAVRLHSAVFSVAARTPVVAISYLPKVSSFMEDCGLTRYVIDADKVNSNSISKRVSSALNSNIKIELENIAHEKMLKVFEYSTMAMRLLR